MTSADQWAPWLLQDRFGSDPEIEQSVREALQRWRNAVLANAAIKPGETVLDVGTGDGLVGLAALHLVGEEGHVIFTDVSAQLLEVCRLTVESAGIPGRATYVVAPAEDLGKLADASVDVVTTRSVLMHVDDREAAFREFRRVLRPGGRLSCFESIASRALDPDDNTYRGYDISPVRPLVDRLRRHAARPAPTATQAMMSFDDCSLSAWAEAAGFSRVHVTLELDVANPSPMRNWNFFYRTSTHPGIPALADEVAEVLSATEAAEFCAHLRPLVEEGRGTRRQAICYLSAAC